MAGRDSPVHGGNPNASRLPQRTFSLPDRWSLATGGCQGIAANLPTPCMGQQKIRPGPAEKADHAAAIRGGAFPRWEVVV